MEKCIICGGKIIRTCKCLRQDSTCENGHEFHWSPYHGEFHLGLSDHSTSTNSPDCCENKIVIDAVNKKFRLKNGSTVNFENCLDVSLLTDEEINNFINSGKEGNEKVKKMYPTEKENLKNVLEQANFENVFEIMNKLYPQLIIDKFIYEAYYNSLLLKDVNEVDDIDNSFVICIKINNEYTPADYIIYVENVGESFVISDIEDFSNRPIEDWLGLKISQELNMNIDEIAAHLLVYLFNLPSNIKSENEIANVLEDKMQNIIAKDSISESLIDPIKKLIEICDKLDTDDVTFSIEFNKPNCTDGETLKEDRIKQYMNEPIYLFTMYDHDYEIPAYIFKDEKLIELFEQSVITELKYIKIYENAVNIIYDKKVKEYCDKNNLNINHFIEECDEEIDKELFEEAFDEASFLCPEGTLFE